MAVTCKPPWRGVPSTAGGALAGRSSCRLRCSTVMVKMAWLRLDLQTCNNTQGPFQVLSINGPLKWSYRINRGTPPALVV